MSPFMMQLPPIPIHSRHCKPLTDPQVQPSPTAMPFSCFRRGEESMSCASMGIWKADVGATQKNSEMSGERVGKSEGKMRGY